MEAFACKDCGYRFESDKKKTVCPYCGEEGTVEREKNANELIESLTE